jgi:hypothetical protein
MMSPCVRACSLSLLGPTFSRAFLTVHSSGLFTPEEYVARQREVQEHAAAAAAAAEEQKEAAKREVSAELQVALARFSFCLR